MLFSPDGLIRPPTGYKDALCFRLYVTLDGACSITGHKNVKIVKFNYIFLFILSYKIIETHTFKKLLEIVPKQLHRLCEKTP